MAKINMNKIIMVITKLTMAKLKMIKLTMSK
jgi:hypothetical protein